MSTDYAHNAKILKKLRVWTNGNLPVYGTYIGYDLGIQILESSTCSHRSSLKEIYHSLPHSEPQLRRKLRVFERDGWIRLEKSHCDQRNHLVIPSEKMLSAYAHYFRLMTELSQEVKLS